MIEKIKTYLLERTFVRHFLEASKRIVLPGFDGMALYDVAEFFINSVMNGAIGMRASALAFKFFLALFPGVIFIFTLIPLIPIDNFQDQLLMQLQTLMPADAFEQSRAAIEEILTQPSTGLLSFSFVFTLYLATNGINAMMDAFNLSRLTFEKRSLIRQRLVAILIFILLALLVLISITLIIFKTVIMNYLLSEGHIEEGIEVFMLDVGEWLMTLFCFYLGISIIYYIGPSKQMRYRFFSAGSSLTAILTILVSMGFAYFVNHFGQYNKIYGSIGSLIVVLLWIYFNCIILLVGFELNSSIIRARRKSLETET